MYDSLELEGFRKFAQYRLGDLARINLLVGENNSGKTTILEAIYLLAARGETWAFDHLSHRRGEVGLLDDDWRGHADLAHLFHNHDFQRKSRFQIVARAKDAASASATLLAEAIHDDADNGHGTWCVNVKFQLENEEGSKKEAHLMRVSPRGVRVEDAPSLGWEMPTVLLLSPFGVPGEGLRELWDHILRRAREGDVVEAMRTIEPRLEQITFLTRPQTASDPRAGVLLNLKGERDRVPLASQGDGLFRLMELSMGLVRTSGGTLVIDEIDTGLHYSVMGDLWRLIVEAARRFDVQVFATTHSYDCIRGLAWLCEQYPHLGQEVAVHKIEPALEEAVTLDAEKIQIAFRQHIEMR